MSAIVNISPPMRLQFTFNGNQAVGFQLFTYAAGTSVKQTTYIDNTGDTPNTNPIILDAQGSASVWLTEGQQYKFVLAFPHDNDPPQNPIWTQDYILGVGDINPNVKISSDNITYNGNSDGDGCLSSVDRTLTSKLRDILSVKDEGALGDGITDDTGAFKAAYGCAVQGQTILVPATSDSYNVGNFTGTKDVIWDFDYDVGANPPNIPGTIKYGAGGQEWYYRNLVDAYAADNTGVVGVTLTQNSSATSGLITGMFSNVTSNKNITGSVNSFFGIVTNNVSNADFTNYHVNSGIFIGINTAASGGSVTGADMEARNTVASAESTKLTGGWAVIHSTVPSTDDVTSTDPAVGGNPWGLYKRAGFTISDGGIYPDEVANTPIHVTAGYGLLLETDNPDFRFHCVIHGATRYIDGFICNQSIGDPGTGSAFIVDHGSSDNGIVLKDATYADNAMWLSCGQKIAMNEDGTNYIWCDPADGNIHIVNGANPPPGGNSGIIGGPYGPFAVSSTNVFGTTQYIGTGMLSANLVLAYQVSLDFARKIYNTQMQGTANSNPAAQLTVGYYNGLGDWNNAFDDGSITDNTVAFIFVPCYLGWSFENGTSPYATTFNNTMHSLNTTAMAGDMLGTAISHVAGTAGFYVNQPNYLATTTGGA